jgi:PST family polysaccharide transporter
LEAAVTRLERLLAVPNLRARLTARTGLRQVLQNTGWLVGDRVLRLAVGLVVGVWTARYLGPEQFGLLSYSAVVVSLFAFLATLGLDNVVIRDVVANPGQIDETLGSAFVLKLGGGLLASLLALAAVRLLRPGDGIAQTLVAVLALSSVFQAFDTIDFWFQSQVASKYTVYAKNTAFLLASAGRVLVMLLGGQVVAIAVASVVEAVAGACGLAAIYLARGRSLAAWRVSVERIRSVLAHSWPLALSGAAIMIYMKVDVVMLRQLASDEAVGVYSAATRISELWYFVPLALVTSLFPGIVALKARDERLYYLRLKKLFGLLAAIGLGTALAITVLSRFIVSLLYGPSYAGAAPMLAVHIWAAPFVFLGVAQSPWDLAEGLTRLVLQRTVLGAIVNVALNALLLPHYAGFGAAVATVVAYACAAWVGNLLDRRTRRIFWAQAEALSLAWVWRRSPPSG